MSFAEALAATACRAPVAAAGAVALAHLACGCLVAAGPASRRAMAASLALVLVMPPLVTGYAWADVAHRLGGVAWRAELLLAALLALKLVPLATLLLWLAPPPPLTAAAAHCVRLLEAGGRRPPRALRPLAHLWLGPIRTPLLAFVLTGVVAFQDLELATLLGARAWTVALFDARAAGASLGETLARVALPVGCQALALLAVVRAAWAGPTDTAFATRAAPATALRRLFGATVIVTALSSIVLWPLSVLLRDALPQLGDVLRRASIAGDAAVSAAFALLASAGALVLAALLWRGRAAVLVVACLPGLSGALALGLAAQALFQLPGLAAAYDSVAPLYSAAVLWLLPQAVLLLAALGRFTATSPAFSARLLRNAPDASVRRRAAGLYRSLAVWPLVAVGWILFTAALFEPVASTLLAPSGVRPAAATLLNLMHYGRSGALSALVVCLVGWTLFLPAVAWLVLRWPRLARTVRA